MTDPFPDKCPCCGGNVGALPYDWSGKPKLMACFSHDPPAMFCEECQEPHKGCGVLRRAED